MVGWRMNSEGSGDHLTEVLSWHLPGGSEEHQKKSVRIFGVPAEIQVEHLSKQA
jgi:hypothetical protein